MSLTYLSTTQAPCRERCISETWHATACSRLRSPGWHTSSVWRATQGQMWV